jgi:hypothetical protein
MHAAADVTVGRDTIFNLPRATLMARGVPPDAALITIMVNGNQPASDVMVGLPWRLAAASLRWPCRAAPAGHLAVCSRASGSGPPASCRLPHLSGAPCQLTAAAAAPQAYPVGDATVLSFNTPEMPAGTFPLAVRVAGRGALAAPPAASNANLNICEPLPPHCCTADCCDAGTVWTLRIDWTMIAAWLEV